jgi:hypothetical protein
MSSELALTPAGRIRFVELSEDGIVLSEHASRTSAQDGTQRIAKAFGASQAEGLFCLATTKTDDPLAPSFVFWRSFSERYLTDLCHTPQVADVVLEAVALPSAEERAAMLLGVPPMPGAEYLSDDTLTNTWQELDAWVRDQVAACPEGLSGFLKRRAALWHQIGRVCFHLAENKRDESFPFAFLATYAPGVTGGNRVQYQPLGKALQEYAGTRNKQGLIKLLSPVQRASQSSPLVRDLVDVR